MPKPISPKINWNHPITKRLILALPFFEGGRTKTNDIISSNNGNFNTTGVTWGIDIFGKTISFAGGVSDYLQVLNNSIFDVSQGTIITTIKTSQSANFVFVHTRSSATQSASGFTLFLDSSTSALRLQIKTATPTTVCDITGGGNLRDGKLHIVALTFTQANGGTNILYVDGIQVATGTNSAAWTFNGQNISWGASNDTFWTPLNGSQSFGYWWSRILSSQEINQLYTNPWQIYTKPGMLQPLNSIAATVINNTYKSLTGAGNI